MATIAWHQGESSGGADMRIKGYGVSTADGAEGIFYRDFALGWFDSTRLH